MTQTGNPPRSKPRTQAQIVRANRQRGQQFEGLLRQAVALAVRDNPSATSVVVQVRGSWFHVRTAG